MTTAEQSLVVLAPVAGTVRALADVPDPVFAEAMVGPGIAVDPGTVERAEVRAPVSGVLVKMHPHAFALVGAGGRGVLVHLGIDTVQLAGAGFTLHAAEKDAVEAGQLLVTFSPAQVAAGGRSPITPVIALDTVADSLTLAVETGQEVLPGEELFSWT
ncbi:PTS sugar transporter subunit IIA [Georgenia alba]|uniref:PTS glucose transporter subunit IIA n=1 Tax=Georgenia alba TaxID=2233858 RepID=A0ABW2QB63_9MICO